MAQPNTVVNAQKGVKFGRQLLISQVMASQNKSGNAGMEGGSGELEGIQSKDMEMGESQEQLELPLALEEGDPFQESQKTEESMQDQDQGWCPPSQPKQPTKQIQAGMIQSMVELQGKGGGGLDLDVDCDEEEEREDGQTSPLPLSG